jgi:hypothetical protein
MTNISINISGRIDPERVSVLREINDVAKELNINFFVVGAFARDVIFSTVEKILARETDEDQGFRMLSHMVKGVSLQSIMFEKSLQLLRKLLQGIREEMQRE